MSPFYTVVVPPNIIQGHEICNATGADGTVWTVEEKHAELKRLGVTHILNLNDRRQLEGFAYHCAPMIDDKHPDKPGEWYKECLEYALPALASGGVLYIHCVAGVARSSAITYAILRATGHTIQDSFAAPAQRPGFEIFYLSAAEYALRCMGAV